MKSVKKILAVAFLSLCAFSVIACKKDKTAELEARLAEMSVDEKIAYYIGTVTQPTGFTPAVPRRGGVGVEDRCSVRIYVQTILTEDHFITKASEYGLDVANEIFAKIPEINLLRFEYEMNFVDGSGKEFKAGAYAFTLTRENFAKINMANFRDKVTIDYNSLWAVAEDVFINPNIGRALKKYRQ